MIILKIIFAIVLNSYFLTSIAMERNITQAWEIQLGRCWFGKVGQGDIAGMQRMCLENHTDLTALQNEQGQTALDIAKALNNTKLIAYLTKEQPEKLKNADQAIAKRSLVPRKSVSTKKLTSLEEALQRALDTPAPDVPESEPAQVKIYVNIAEAIKCDELRAQAERESTNEELMQSIGEENPKNVQKILKNMMESPSNTTLAQIQKALQEIKNKITDNSISTMELLKVRLDILHILEEVEIVAKRSNNMQVALL